MVKSTAVAVALCFGAASAFVPSTRFMGASVTSRMASTRGPAMSAVEKSKSIPFLPRPENLDGSVPGDVGEYRWGRSRQFMQ
jgi:hypothetical protein